MLKRWGTRSAALAACVLAAALLAPAASGQTIKPRIVNGEVAQPGEYPWQVALVRSGGKSPRCGGTLLDDRIVLTAAHCTMGWSPDELQVIAGLNDLSGVVPGANRLNIDTISLHPFAEVGDDDPFAVPRRDLSLLVLAADAPATAQPLQIATENEVDGAASFDVTGWGATSSGGATSALLRWARIERVDDATCGGQFGEVFSPTDQLCAVAETNDGGVIDACQGDSGGPLALTGSDKTDPSDWRLAGVTSWGAACASRDDDDAPYPGVYARVASGSLRSYATSLLDLDPANDPLEQPYYISGAVAVQANPKVGGAIACGGGQTITWGGVPDLYTYAVRRGAPASGGETVSVSGVYTFKTEDAGKTFHCEVRATRAGAGGMGLAWSAAVNVATLPPPTQPPPTVVEVPGPTVTTTVTVPGPTVTVPVPSTTPRQPLDERAPSITGMRRTCSMVRVCTIRVTVTDPAPSSGVKTLYGIVTSATERRCRVKGRTATCTRVTTRVLRARRTATGFTLRSPASLGRGRHSVVAVAVDGAGNVQPRPSRLTFRLR